MLLSDSEILEAIEKQEIEIGDFYKDSLQPASYDLRLGKKAIVTKSTDLRDLKDKISSESAPEIDIEKEGSLKIPAGAFALITTLEKLTFSNLYAAHIGMRSYYTRKGLILLSGLQVDPGFEGVLVLGLANLSPRSVVIEYGDPICTIEIHKLNKPSSKPYSGPHAKDQKDGRIPSMDKDYLRTIETLSMTDLTQSLMRLSDNVDSLGKDIKVLYWLFGILFVFIPIVITIIELLFKK